MTPTELTRKGFQALVDALGYVDAVRFIKQFDQGHSDYTQNRTNGSTNSPLMKFCPQSPKAQQ